MSVSRDAKGLLRYVKNGRSYRVHGSHRSYYIMQKGVPVTCTSAIKRYLTTSGGMLETLPTAAIDSILSKGSRNERKAMGETSHTMNTSVKQYNRRLSDIANSPISTFKLKLKTLTKDELVSLENYVSDNAPPFSFGQNEDELMNITNMENFLMATHKLQLIEDQIAGL